MNNININREQAKLSECLEEIAYISWFRSIKNDIWIQWGSWNEKSISTCLSHGNLTPRKSIVKGESSKSKEDKLPFDTYNSLVILGVQSSKRFDSVFMEILLTFMSIYIPHAQIINNWVAPCLLSNNDLKIWPPLGKMMPPEPQPSTYIPRNGRGSPDGAATPQYNRFLENIHFSINYQNSQSFE